MNSSSYPLGGVWAPNDKKYSIDEYKPESRNGIKFMYIAIILYTLLNLLGVLNIFSRRPYFLFNYFLGWAWVYGFGLAELIVATAIYIVLMIIVILAIFKFFTGRFEHNEQHRKNIKLAIVMFYAFVIISIPLFFGYHGAAWGWGLLYLVFLFAGILQAFFLGYAILLLAHEFAGDMEKDILYIFTTVMIIMPIILSLDLGYFQSAQIHNVSRLYIAVRTLIASIILLIAWYLAAIVYHKILKSFDINGKFSPKQTHSFLPKPKSLTKYTGTFLTRPLYAILTIFVIYIIFAAVSGTAYYLYSPPNKPESPKTAEPEVILETYDGLRELEEGESWETTVTLKGKILNLTAGIHWSDETDQVLRDNQPDCFTMEIKVNDIFSETSTAENEHNSIGVLYHSKSFTDYEFEDIKEFNIILTVTLNYCGDQTGQYGYMPEQFNIEDNSNIFNYFILVEYLPQE